MEKQKYVYIILENWEREHGESDVNVTIFLTYEKMKEYYQELKENYKNDYSNNENLIFEETIKDEEKYIILSAYDEYSSDRFEILCHQEEVRS